MRYFQLVMFLSFGIINNLINEIKRLGFSFSLILRKRGWEWATGAEQHSPAGCKRYPWSRNVATGTGWGSRWWHPWVTSKRVAPFIRHRSQRVGELDSDDDFVRPGTAPTRPAKGTVVLYHSLPELVGPYETVTASRKKSFAAKLLKARIIMYY